MATYLVTGAAGFIASKVAEQLLAAGHRVVGVDNLNDYYDVRLKDYRLSKLLSAKGEELSAKTQRGSAEMVHASMREPWSDSAGVSGGGSPLGSTGHNLELGTDPKVSLYAAKSQEAGARTALPLPLTAAQFSFYHLDIENLAALEEVFKAHKFEAVFNLAARAGVRYSLEFPELYRRTNVLGEENVLKCQVKYGVKKHVLASSSSVYAGCPMPFTEDAVLGKMQSPYAETKRQAELLALDYHQKHGIDVTALRYFTVFGPAGRPDMAPFRFIKWIDEGTPITLYGDGTQARDFTYVDDIARGTILAGRLVGGQRTEDRGQLADNGQRTTDNRQLSPSFDIINLGGGNNPLTITAMIGIIGAALGKKAKIDSQPPSAADMKETWADITKAKRLLAWSPQISPEDGFRRTVEWHLANRDWLKGVKP